MKNSNVMKFRSFLAKLGYNLQDKHAYTYCFKIYDAGISDENIEVEFVYLSKLNNEDLYNQQLKVWNQNRINVYVIVSDEKTLLMDGKIKPNLVSLLLPEIMSFDYGINTEGFSGDELEILKKQNFDTGYFWNYIADKIQYKKRLEVDKDLLLNLIALKNTLVTGSNDSTIHLLILRCLFIKYLEDRGIYEKDYLINILRSKSILKLLSSFDEIRKINGDIFKFDQIKKNDISLYYLEQLDIFFSSDFRTGQSSLFPYRFNYIPVNLISHVYEAFIKTKDKQGKGVYYTPQNLVNFMLSSSLANKLHENKHATLLDPACGSGIFLVEAFKQMILAKKAETNYEEKVKILTTQIFGIDIDSKALQIAVFSLYLTLLEKEEVEFIKDKIRNNNPILPSLIDRTLIGKNTIVDKIKFFKNGKLADDITFDCIVANPPWGSVPLYGDVEDKRERNAKDSYDIYKNVSKYQRSQFFLLRIEKWMNENTIACLIVNNSNFYNDKSRNFRNDFLNKYELRYFYELSNVNQILFKRRVIGEIERNGIKEVVKIGADEPCVILIFTKNNTVNHNVNYITPRLNKLSKFLRLITFSNEDIKVIRQDILKENDILWKVFVNGNIEDFNLINKIDTIKDGSLEITCTSGLKPSKKMVSLGVPNNKHLVTSKDFESYFIDEKRLTLFDINREMERDRKQNYDLLFCGQRILVYVSPSPKDKLKLRAVFTNKEMVFKDELVSLKFNKNVRLYEAILNSSLVGYYLFNVSAQWGKGPKHVKLRNEDLEELPMPILDSNNSKIFNEIDLLVKKLKVLKSKRRNAIVSGNYRYTSQSINLWKDDKLNFEDEIVAIEEAIDLLVLDLYSLNVEDKLLIKDFYLNNYFRKNDDVKKTDLQLYVDAFRAIFNFILNESKYLNAKYKIGYDFGAILCFEIVDIKFAKEEVYENLQIDYFEIIKRKTISDHISSFFLKENKVKIYDKNRFYIFKTTKFSEWTEKKAVNDAKEEISVIMKDLPNS